MLADKKFTGAYGYIAMYKGRRLEVWSDEGQYHAQTFAAKLFKAKKSHEVSITLCERPDGSDVVHTPDT